MVDHRSTFALKKVTILDGAAEHALLAGMPAENGFTNEAYGIAPEDFPGWLAACVKMADGIDLPDGFVPQTSYWFYAGGIPVGRLKLRHRLNDALLLHGGHIGYGIAAPHRGKGYAAQMLRLGLQEAHALGIEQALVTIDVDNIPSRRVAETCGGILQDEEGGTARYWLPTAPPKK